MCSLKEVKRMATKKVVVKKKKKFINMEITRVAMNPEQAVLSCCDSELRAMVYGTMTLQCVVGPACSSASSDFATSS